MIKPKTSLIFLTCIMIVLQTRAQYTFVRNAVYAEVMGNGLWYSVNYERMLWGHEDILLAMRLGYSLQKYRYVQNKYYTSCFPLELNVPMRLKKEHMLELGLGCSPFLYHKEVIDTMGNATALPVSGIRAFYCGRFGYRYQPENKGLLFRIAITPLFSNQENPDFGIQTLWFGISGGYCF